MVFGRQAGFPAALNLSDLDGSNGFVLNGIDVGDKSGWSVSTAGDINGDGLDDVIVGAWEGDPNGIYNAGESYVVFGRQGGFPTTLNLADLDGANGFVINGIDFIDSSGHSVAAGDVNGDGLNDVIIGAPVASPNGNAYAGESYIVFGHQAGFPAALNLADLDGSNGIVLNGIDSGDGSGAVAAGDVNGDGLDDVIIGASRADPNASRWAGESYVVFGRRAGFPAALNLSDLDGSNGFVLNGIDAGDRSGISVAAAGDINGDGVDDVIIGAVEADPNGNVYVVFGIKVEACEGDFDNDGDVDGTDLSLFGVEFGSINCTACQADFDNDGDVDGDDLSVFSADFGRTNCPLR